MSENENINNEIQNLENSLKEKGFDVKVYAANSDSSNTIRSYYTKTIKFYNEDILKAKHLFDLVFYLQKQLNEKYFSSFFLKIMNEGIKEICKENNIDYQKLLNDLFSIQNIL